MIVHINKYIETEAAALYLQPKQGIFSVNKTNSFLNNIDINF